MRVGINHHYLEHRHLIERRSTDLGAVAIAALLGQQRSKAFELRRARQTLQRIAVLAQPLQVLRQRKQAAWVHQNSPSNARE